MNYLDLYLVNRKFLRTLFGLRAHEEPSRVGPLDVICGCDNTAFRFLKGRF